MSELESVIPQAERQLPLEPQPRQFTANDVANIQRYMQELSSSSLAEGADYVPSKSGLYDHLTEPDSVSEREPQADESSFDKSVSSLLSTWGERIGLPPDGPKTLAEAKDTFAQNPKLNEISPIHFQGGAEYVTGRFTHVITGRAMGKHREPTARRYYLNPTTDKMGHVVEQLTGAALQSEVPLYFKFVDVATGNPDRRTLSRTDRIVIYASEGQTEFVEGLLGHVVEESPDAFMGRKVAGFGEVLADGVTVADEVTDEQNARFKGHSEGTSFNDLRSQLLYEATLDVTKDLVSFPEFASVKVGDQTIKEVFAAELSKAISKHKSGTVIKADDPELSQALELGLSAEQLRESGKFSENAVRAIQDAVAKTARNVLPGIQPDSLLRGYQHHIKQLAPKYGVDPDNLARNIPVAA